MLSAPFGAIRLAVSRGYKGTLSVTMFRQQALDKLSSPEQLDQLLDVIRPKGWLALLGLCALLIGGGVWSVIGALPSRVEGRGILLKKGGLTRVNALSAGQLTEISVRPGSDVKVGQVLAQLALPDLRAELEMAQASMANLQAQNVTLTEFGKDDIQLQRAVIAQRRRAAQEQLRTLHERSQTLDRKLASQHQLLSEGLITEQALQDTRDSLIVAQADADRARGVLKELSAKRVEDTQRKQQEAGERRIRIDELQRRVRELQDKIDRYSTLTSPVDGRVLEVRAALGTLVAPGLPIFMLEPAGQAESSPSLDAFVYVPGVDGKKIAPGMAVEVSPSTVVREEYGAIVGTVVSVAEYPTSAEAIATRLGSTDLAASFAKTVDTPIELHIALKSDPKTRSGLRWTSPKGPPVAVQQGTLCRVWITTRVRAPIRVLLPILSPKDDR